MKQPRLAPEVPPCERHSIPTLTGLALRGERGSASCWRYQPRRGPIWNPLRTEVLPPHSDCLRPVDPKHGGQPGREPGASRCALDCPEEVPTSSKMELMPGGLVASKSEDRRRIHNVFALPARGATPITRRLRRAGEPRPGEFRQVSDCPPDASPKRPCHSVESENPPVGTRHQPVDLRGLEPRTLCLQSTCATSCAIGP